ncbi:AAA family ATPase [Halodesulfovibrio sp.]|uniref:ATP-dependent nuclease n=1 Tax=Halodesulfovibrio sp. TaxID=1912772 RepID=UPI0025C14766|nr:AAA family ATPase [Halodesulfovibrio sp.]
MEFPIEINCMRFGVKTELLIRSGITTILGPNGSGKTQLMRGMQQALGSIFCSKKVVFVSAGRVGQFESYRADCDGQRNGRINYDGAQFAYKKDVVRQHQIETLNGGFLTFSSRPDIRLKVQERLRKLLQREVTVNWDTGSLKIFFSTSSDPEAKEYSAGREASGLLHVVCLLARLYDDDIGVLFLDEPEVSLHPQLQLFLQNEISRVAGYPTENSYKKIIIQATHSAEMFSLRTRDDLSSLIFCNSAYALPLQIDPEHEVLKGRKVQNLLARLRHGHKAALFASKPFLVEGISDEYFVNFLSGHFDFHIEATGSYVLPVLGNDELLSSVKLFNLMGKKCIVLTDPDTLVDSSKFALHMLSDQPELDQELAKDGHDSCHQLAKKVLDDFKKLVATNWDDIKQYACQHAYWSGEQEDAKDIEKEKRRAAFCSLFCIPDEELRAMAGGAFLIIKSRLEKLLTTLTCVGCFVLRKGAIESYYLDGTAEGNSDKINRVLQEIEKASALSIDKVKAQYGDLYDAVKFAAKGVLIDEAESMQDMLLNVVPAVVNRLSNITNAQEAAQMAKRLSPEKASLFTYEVSDSKLVVGLKSPIIDVKGFPIVISKDDNPYKLIEEAIRNITS